MSSEQEKPGQGKPSDGSPDAAILLIHEANGVIAVRKPAGLATQAPSGIDSMEGRVRAWLERSRGGGYLGVPHRLDRPVSGVILFAVTPRAARQLSRQFERRAIVKRYAALLEPSPSGPPPADDWPSDDWMEWRDRLAKIANEPRARVVPTGEHCPEAREAVTRVRLMTDAGEGRSAIAVEFQPVTGRMHQLRVQAASRGMPVLGDSLYGSTTPFPEVASATDVPPIALHACRIEFLDPDTRSPVVVESPPPWRAAQGRIQPADSIQT